MEQDNPAGGAMNETSSDGGVLGQHQEHRPRMAEKMKKTFSSMKVRVGGGHQYSSPPGNAEDNVSPDGGRVGDAVAPTNTGGIARSHREGEAASPKIPHKDFGERIMDFLPGTHANPYSTGYPVNKPQGANPYVASDESAASPTTPPVQQSTQTSGGILGKLKNLMTGQRPAQGAATDNATKELESTSLMSSDGYSQSPTPQSGDFLERTKEKIGMGGHKGGPDAVSEEGWPAPAKPDFQNKPGATYTDEKSQPIEGPTQPKSEDTKKEGLMTKIMDKIHPPPKTSASPKVPTTGTTDTVPSENTTTFTPPIPTQSDYHNKSGATYTDEKGHPVEGPTQPMSEDTKKEGLMTKIMDKIHPQEKSSTSPRAATTAPSDTVTA